MHDAKLDAMMKKMMEQVDTFQRLVTKVPYSSNGVSFPEKSRHGHIAEELMEIIECHAQGDIAGVVDGYIDMIYVAIGTLLQMGIHPEYPFSEVHEANMKKEGAKTKRHDYDAVKPVGWKPPDIGAVLEHLEVLYKVSPILVALTKMRLHKGNNYNRGNVKREDHFPLGDLSFFQVVWMKMCRVRSLTENPGNTVEEKVESRRLAERELSDIIVYSEFWIEHMQRSKQII